MELKNLGKEHRTAFVVAAVGMLGLAFFQCYRITHDLHWPYDTDFDRDMSFIRNSLEGKFGKDPNYLGEYLWYNPLLFSIEAFIVKVTGLPINIVIMKAGIYFNILGPITFFIMNCYFFGYRIGLASLLSFLFLASGDFMGTGAATYSPWLYPCCFSQFMFYLTLMACYKAFSKQAYGWFLLVGVCIGIAFLGHAAPAFLVILIMISVQGKKMIRSFAEKNYVLLKKYFFQGCITFIAFAIVASPFLYYVAGKYHLHIINTNIFEYQSDLMIWRNILLLIKANLSIAFVISIIGFVWFYKTFHEATIRTIILNWFFISGFMLAYSMSLPGFHDKLHIPLPDTVPSYHYLHYLKAVQSVFFGFGIVFLFQQVSRFIIRRIPNQRVQKVSNANSVYILVLVLWAMVYFPVYKERKDFTLIRKLSLAKENNVGKMQVYDYIIANIPSDNVILCEEQYSIFPVMATGRKLVCASILFSNPYIDFGKRYADLNVMLASLKNNAPGSKKLFEHYKVNYALLSNALYKRDSLQSPLLGKAIFSNEMFTLFDLNKEGQTTLK